MFKKPLPSSERLHELLAYDPTTGALTWKARPLWMFRDVSGRSAFNCQTVWNAKYAGKPAGTAKTYISIKIEGDGFQAHRVIWKMETGLEPDEIDHWDRDKHNNKWANLRDVGHAANMRNKFVTPLNTSGHKHVSWSRKLERWIVQLNIPGKGQRQIAWENSLPAAIAARDAAYSRFGYDIRTDAA
jgi:hypothetical protein